MQASLFDSCKAYIRAYAEQRAMEEPELLPAITISREAGAGAVTIGEKVKEILQARNKARIPWAVFDKNLVERVLSDHRLPQQIKEFMPEDVRLELNSAVEEVLGLHPSSWSLAEHTTDTILRLAKAGHSIIVGRGGCVIASKLPNVLHVRLVAPVEVRIIHIKKLRGLTEREAGIYVHKADRARHRYVKRFFEAEVDDPLHYHMVLNTGLITYDHAAQMIAEAALKLTHTHAHTPQLAPA